MTVLTLRRDGFERTYEADWITESAVFLSWVRDCASAFERELKEMKDKVDS